MLERRPAHERGKANFGWLDSYHSFSFGSYYDPAHMGHSTLRVINDDTVAAGAGFGTHGHRDMEIISFVTQGTMEHKDSMGNVQILPQGEFQLMSAGRGITHSEYNASSTEQLKFLQIWIVPESQGGEPGYQQKRFAAKVGVTPIITPDGENGTLKIKQQARLSQLLLTENSDLQLNLEHGRHAYVHVIEGQLSVNGQDLGAGDGLKISEIRDLHVNTQAHSTAMALLFELP
jgi:quercetin 2,3-dioxygenase